MKHVWREKHECRIHSRPLSLSLSLSQSISHTHSHKLHTVHLNTVIHLETLKCLVRLQPSVSWCQGSFSHLWQTSKSRLEKLEPLGFNENIGRLVLRRRAKATLHKSIRLVFIKLHKWRGVLVMRLLGWFNIHYLWRWRGTHRNAGKIKMFI